LEFRCALARTFLGDNDAYLEDICTMPQGSGVEQAERGSPSHMSPNNTANECKSDADNLTVGFPY